MCESSTIRVVCPTCERQITSHTNMHWCREARRRALYGRCRMGNCKKDEEYRGLDCNPCRDKAEEQMVKEGYGYADAKGYTW